MAHLKNHRNMKTKKVHISEIKPGDTIICRDGKTRTVCNNNIKKSFIGITLYGDSYNCGYILVEKVIF